MSSHPCYILALLVLLISPALAEQIIEARPVASAPAIDGFGDDPAWASAVSVITHDKVADIDLELKAVHTEDQIFIMVRYPDSDESRLHRSWSWDSEQDQYKSGGDREDVMVLKWWIDGESPTLSTSADQPYRADIWYWKACRTDPVGFADDKIQTLDSIPSTRSQEISSPAGRSMYLTRLGDKGTSSYATKIPGSFQGNQIPRFNISRPSGSRADIRARGRWADGWWVIEFARALDTGHDDDVVLHVGDRHFFGISRYEIAANPADPRTEVPLFRSGDVGEALYLTILE